MNDILLKLIKNPEARICYSEICEALYGICDIVHVSCNDTCPVYALMTKQQQEQAKCECPYIKNGQAMYEYIKQHGVK